MASNADTQCRLLESYQSKTGAKATGDRTGQSNATYTLSCSLGGPRIIVYKPIRLIVDKLHIFPPEYRISQPSSDIYQSAVRLTQYPLMNV